MQRIADWLEKLGMSENAGRFAENRIDFSVLPELTDQDLKDLGIVLADRRKILRAIAALDSARAAQSAPWSRGSGRRCRSRQNSVVSRWSSSGRQAPLSQGVVLRDLVGAYLEAASPAAIWGQPLPPAHREQPHAALGNAAQNIEGGRIGPFGRDLFAS
jgi:uncharacterized protein YjiS (DUF1127 family)